jgi:uncharacterized protein (TIGR03066 family)
MWRVRVPARERATFQEGPVAMKNAKPPRPVPAIAPATDGARRLWLLLPLGLAAFLLSWAVLELVVWNVLPEELLGKWVVTQGPQEGATFDFYRSGKMIGRINQAGKLHIIDAVVRLEDNKIYSTTRHPQTGQETTVAQTIRTLTAWDLVVEDSKGIRTYMKRAE